MKEPLIHVDALAGSAVVDIYLSGNNDRVYWPNGMQRADNSISDPQANHSYMLHTGYDGDRVSNDDLINEVDSYFQGYIIPNHTVNTPDVSKHTAIEETADSVCDVLDRVDESNFPTVLVPLQPPFDFQLDYLKEHYPRQLRRSHFAICGVKDAGTDAQLTAARDLRNVLGYSAYVHGFGFEVSREMLLTLRKEAGLLDAVDFSPPIHNKKSGSTGENEHKRTNPNLIFAEMVNIARVLNSDVTDEEISFPE